jgi:hypothetical protein
MIGDRWADRLNQTALLDVRVSPVAAGDTSS